MQLTAKAAPVTVQGRAVRRGANHVLVSRKSSTRLLRARVHKLLRSGWHEVHLHGLGAALAPTVALAARLVHESDGVLVADTTTSTEMLVDRADESALDDSAQLRFNSAVHIRLSSVGKVSAVR